MKTGVKKTKLEEFIKRVDEPEELKRILFELFIKVENLTATVRRLNRTIEVNVNAKRIIPPNDIQILSPSDSIYLPKSQTVCRINTKCLTENLFDSN